MGRREDVEVIKVELPKSLAEKFRRYVAEKEGFRRGALSRAIADLIERELMLSGSGDINQIVGLGLQSDYLWEGEDIVEALRKRVDVST